MTDPVSSQGRDRISDETGRGPKPGQGLSWSPGVTMFALVVFSASVFWVAWSEIDEAKPPDGGRGGWLLFAIGYVGGILFSCRSLWAGHRAPGRLPVSRYQAIGRTLAMAALVWWQFASLNQRLAVIGVLGGGTIVFTAWFGAVLFGRLGESV